MRSFSMPQGGDEKSIYMHVSNKVKRKDGAIRGTKLSAISN